MGRCERSRSGSDSQCLEPFALSPERGNRRTHIPGCFARSLEVDVRSQILLSGIGEHGREAVSGDGLERLARTAPLVAVIDDQSNASMLAESTRDFGNRFLTYWRLLEDLAIAIKRETAPRQDYSAFYTSDELPHWKRI